MNWSNTIRQVHRWVSIAFTVAVIINIAAMTQTQPAFWVGLLYDDVSLDAAWDLVKDWTAFERQSLRDDVPRLGFKARIRNRYVFEVAKECLTLAHHGLRRRGRIDHLGRDESRYLEPLDQIIDSGRSPAEEMLEKFNGPWHGSVEPAYDEYAF